MKKYFIILIGCFVAICIYHLSAHADSFLNNFFYAKMQWIKPGSFWPSFVLMAWSMFIICLLIIIKILFKLLAEVLPKYKRPSKVTRTLINFGAIPFFCFQFIYNPLNYYNIFSLNNTTKWFLICAEIGLILLAITLTIRKDNDLYLKE